jgi:hypothetical protein
MYVEIEHAIDRRKEFDGTESSSILRPWYKHVQPRLMDGPEKVPAADTTQHHGETLENAKVLAQ